MSSDKQKPPLLYPKPAITRGRVITRSTSLELNSKSVSTTSAGKARFKNVSFSDNVTVISEECEDQVEAESKTTLHLKYAAEKVIAEDEIQLQAEPLPELQLKPVEVFVDRKIANNTNPNVSTPQPQLDSKKVSFSEEPALVHYDDDEEYVQIEVVEEQEPESKQSLSIKNLKGENVTDEEENASVDIHLGNLTSESLDNIDLKSSYQEKETHSHEYKCGSTTLTNQELYSNCNESQQFTPSPLPPRVKDVLKTLPDGKGFYGDSNNIIVGHSCENTHILKKETANSLSTTTAVHRDDTKNKPKPKPRKIVKPIVPPPPPPKHTPTPNSTTNLTDEQKEVGKDLLFRKTHTAVEIKTPIRTSDQPGLHQEETPVNSSLPNVVSHGRTQQTQTLSPKLIYIIRDLVESEEDYTKQLGEGLRVLDKLRKEKISNETLLKFFGLFERIHLLHRTFLEELRSHSTSPKLVGYCFYKNISRFEMYIERQWLVPNELNFDDFEKFLINSQKLKPYINITKERVAAYVNKLKYLRLNCDKEDELCLETVDDVLAAFDDLFYQLEMVEQFKKIDSFNNIFKECGKVYLNGLFKVSINGSKKKKYLVYLCKNFVIFNILQNNVYHYVEGIPTSKCYCSTKSSKPASFEVGLSGRKHFILTAESQAVKERWCEELKKVLRSDQFD